MNPLSKKLQFARFILIATVAVAAFQSPVLRGANVTQIANDALATSSFTGSTNWNPAGAPLAGNTYQSGFIFRTPQQSGNPAPFAGDSLEMLAGGEFRDKTAGTVSVGNLILDNTAIVSLTDPNGVNSATNTGTLTGSITLAAGATAVFLSGEQGDTTGDTFTIAATIGGTGGFTTAGTGAIANSRGAVVLTASNSYSGGTTVQSTSVGTLQLGNINAVQNSPVTIGTANTLTFSPGLGKFNIGSLAGTVNETLLDLAASPVTLNVGNNNGVNTVYSGNLGGAGAVLNKIGTSTLTLSGANTYTGGTTVSNGILLVNGSLTSGVNIASSGTLGGSGTISGAVTNKAGGTLQPGLGGTDTSTLTITNNLTLAGSTVFALNRANAQNASKIAGVGTLNQGGTLTVTNVGPALQAGDTFTLFSAATYAGSFGATNLPGLAAGLFWSNTISVNGTITVAGTNSTLPASSIVLLHRYSFTSDATDSIGGANGTLPNGGTFSGGQLSFAANGGTPATAQYLVLPGGIVNSNSLAATIDMWATIQTGLPTFCYLYCIGNTDTNGLGYDYIFLNPQYARVTISGVDPGFNAEQGGNFPTLAGANNMHITSVFDCPNGVIRIYTNGVLSTSFTGITDPLSVVGPQFTYIGRSLYNDSFFNWSINELRIYNGALSPLQVAAADVVGPDSTNLSLGTVTNLQLQVPTNQLALGTTEPSAVYAQTTVLTNLINFSALCTYSSGNSNILQVNANGVITAFGLGSATITAQYSNVSSAPVTITVYPGASSTLVHRYSFTSNANDSVGTANGTLQGNAVITNGTVLLDGVNSFVNLPSGLISSLSDVTFEAWVTPNALPTWSRIFDFGNNTGGAGGQGTGLTYAFLTAAAGGGPVRFALTINGNGAESPVLNGPAITTGQAYYFAVVYSPSANISALYVNGSLVASGTATSPLSSVSDVNDWLGKSQFNDPYFNGSIDEFRIWLGALGAGQIASDYTNGPNNVVVLPPTNAVVANQPATSVFANSAVLNGQILSTGNQTPAVTIYYGTADGGTNAGAWAHSVAMGAQTGSFSTLVMGLNTNTTYYFTASAINSFGTSWATPSLSFTTLATNPMATQVQMLTYHNDNTRQGLNTNETLLTPGNVNSGSFGKLFSYALDGYCYTEPLIMTNLTIPGQGVHDVVFVASEHDTVYALDADNNAGANGGVLWTNNLGNYALSSSGAFGYRFTGAGYPDIVPDVGITGTPVIDPATGTLYVNAFTHEGTNYIHRIHALDVTTGLERSYSPVVVTGSVPGTGRDSSGGVMTFNPLQSNQRGALTLANGIVYVTYAGYADTDPYHGWVMGYYASNLAPVPNSVFCSTPNATTAAFGANAAEGGVWMGGNGLCVDSNNNLYFETGNGSFSQVTNGGDYADSLIKLSTTNGFSVADYFTPNNQLALANADLDLAACGPMLVPAEASSTNHPNLIVAVGKAGTIYLADQTNLGQYNTNGNDSQIVQSVGGQLSTIWSSPVYFNHLVYFQSSSSVLKSFTLTNGVLGTTPSSQATASFGQYNGGPVISANGTNNGIAWVINGAAFGSSGPDVLYAFNATNLSQMFYNSSQNLARDNPGGAMKLTTPTVAGGKVYVDAEYQLSVYGVQVFLDTPVIAPNGGPFTNSVQVSLTDGSPGVNIYYTLDGSTPTTGSTLYTAPFLLTSNAVVSAIATQPGAVNSGVAGASFVNTAALGNGTGLLGQYYTNTLPGNPFVGSPLVRTDAVVNFNWSVSPPFAGMATSNYTVRWTGSIQPQFNETYTLTTVSDDGVRLYVNGQLLINDWVDQAGTNSVSLPLAAQQLYSIEMDYYQHTGNAVAELEWSSPSTTQRVVPQTQLYPYTNPAPTVMLMSPSNNATYTGTASVTINAEADAPYNPISGVSFYANSNLLGTVSNAPYTLTATGLGAGSYALKAVATDGSGLAGTSGVVNLTVSGGSGAAYGLTTNGTVPAFFNLPTTFAGSLPLLLSQTGVFSNTPAMAPVGGLIPYVPNTPLWSDGALKTRYLAVPNNGGAITPGEQIVFAPTGTWTFPAGTVFVKTFSLNTDVNNPGVIHRLETRLLVRDVNGQVYGVTYKWRADNSEADLLTNSLTENIVITNGANTTLQTWYYPSPSDCLACHAGVNNDYVLGVNSRQLNGTNTYAATGVTDNQLRTLNRLGLLNPAIDEGAISNYEKLTALTNLAMSAQERSRSYLDANCAQCHQPGGTGISFDARYDTALTNQDLINYPASVSLGYDHARIIAPSDVWRSVIWDRVNVVDGTNAIKIQMPPLARNVIDTNAVAVLAAWINGLGGVPAEAPPVLTPNGGNFVGLVNVGASAPDTNAVIYYTLDGSLPTTNSLQYTGPVELTNGAVTVTANAWAAGHTNSVATGALFVVQPLYFASAGVTNQSFTLQLVGAAGSNYVLLATTNFTTWVPVATNTAVSNVLILRDSGSSNFPKRFYRVLQQ